MFVETYPWPYHPLVPDPDDPDAPAVPDQGRTVQVFQLRPGDQARLLDWAGGGLALADGGVALSADGVTVSGRLALGDFAVLDADSITCHPAGGFANLFRPTPAATPT